MHRIKNKQVLVIGLGLSGCASARFLLRRGAKVIGYDQKTALDPEAEALCKQGMVFVCDLEKISLKDIDFAILSPGISLTHSLCVALQNEGVEIVGEVEFACRFLKHKAIGITGTNGKTTVTLLVTHVLNSAGIKAKAVGNVGVPITTALMESGETDVFVLELSSYQLETLHTPILDCAAVLNITPDHLDRHGDMLSYARAKMRIASIMKPEGKLYVNMVTKENFQSLMPESDAIQSFGYEPTCEVYTDCTHVYQGGKRQFTLPMLFSGKSNHDAENIMAAYALCAALGVSGNGFEQALKSFQKPAHRIEFVVNKEGVSYYNDSKGTNIDAVIQAVNTMSGPVVLIAGGVDKGASYIPWKRAFNGKVKNICAIGQSARKIHDELSDEIPVEIFSTLEDAVVYASSIAIEGDSILLSPGGSSFDMFKNYEDRGDTFKEIVNRHLTAVSCQLFGGS